MSESIVIVGAGPAGLRCAERLAEAGRAVTLLGDEPGQPYDRVALSKYLAKDVDGHSLITASADRLAALGIRHLPGVRAQGIDREAHLLCTDAGSLAYSALVLATGASPVRLPLPGADLPGVLAYRTRADVDAMIAAAEAGGDAVVIGGGLLGLEAAVGLAKRGMGVTVLHAVDRLMERQLDRPAAARLAATLEAQGVRVKLKALTEAIEGAGRVQAVRLAGGERIAVSLVVMAVGIRPNVALAREAGLAVGRGVLVDGAMRTEDRAIFAIGECAEVHGACCGLVAPALAQAEVAAKTLLGGRDEYRSSADGTVLKVAGAPVWSGGEFEAADAESIVFDDPDGEYRKLALRDGVLVGAVLFGATADAGWYMRLIREREPVTARRETLIFGPAYTEFAA